MANRKEIAVVLALALALIGGCMPFDLRTILDGQDGLALTIEPRTLVLPAGGSYPFHVTGGVGPYTFSVSSGEGTIDAQTGEYFAPANAATAVVTVTDDAGTAASATVTVLADGGPSALSISPSSITLTATSQVTFSAAGGTPPYVFSLASGSGVIDSATGTYTAPVSAGSATVRVTDSAGATADAAVTILAASVALSLTPATMTLSVSSSVTFSAVGGTPPYIFAITTAGSGSPDINSSTGYYVAGTAAGTDVVSVTDAASASASATVTVVALTSSVDYEVVFTSLPPTGTAGAALGAGTFAIANSGTGAGSMTVAWRLYLSANEYYDGGDTLLGSGTIGALASGASTSVPAAGTLPVVEAGAYYLIVEVSASDDINTTNDLSTASPIALAPKDVDYTVLTVSHATGTVAAAAVTGTFTASNAGSGDGGSSVYWSVYASADATPDAGDYILAGGSTGALGAGTSSGAIAFSGTWPSTAPATWYLVAVLYAEDDTNGANNSGASATVAVTGPPAASIDYTVVSVANTGGTTAGDPGSGSFTYRNDGADAGSLAVYWAAYLSLDAVLDLGTDPVIATGTEAALASGATSAAIPFAGTWPSTPATWYFIVVASASDDVNGANNEGVSTAVSTAAPDVDYLPQSVTNTGDTTAGDAGSGTFTIRNSGSHAGGRTVYWTAYLSANAALDLGTDPVIDTGSISALGAGATSASIGFSGTWPSSPGSWYLLAAVSAADDNNSANDDAASSAVLTTVPDVDYTVASVTSTGGTVAAGPLSGTFTAENAGTHDGTAGVAWRVYISVDTNLSIGTDVLAASGTIASPGLAASGSQPVPFTGTWPAAFGTATYYLIAVVDADDDVNAANDDTASSVVVVNPRSVDYVVDAVSNAGGTAAGGALSATCTIRNAGTYTGDYSVSWTAYLSADATLDLGTDAAIDAGESSALPPGGTYSPAFTSTWPSGVSTWYLIVRVYATDDTTPGNNWRASGAISTTAPDYIITTVPLPTGSTTGQAVSGTFTVENTGTGAGTSLVNWDVYSSVDDNAYDAGDVLLQSGSFAGLAAAGSTSPAYAGTWPGKPGTYYIVVRVSTVDDATIADAASPAVTVANPPPPDYTVSFSSAIPWSGLRSNPMNATGTNEIVIQNTSTNTGYATITWMVHLSADRVLDGSDILVQQGTVGALAGSASTTANFGGGEWPSITGGYVRCFIASVHASDDSSPVNDVVPAPHVCAIGDYRYLELGEDNSGEGAYPPVPSPFSDTGVGGMAPNEGMVIEGTMDIYNEHDTYAFTVSASMTLNLRILWATGYDDLDLKLWDDVGSDLGSLTTAVDSEPGGATYDVTIPSARICFASAYMYLENNTSGSTGQKYVIVVRSLP